MKVATIPQDFRTDVDPSLYIDNWGVDAVEEHGDKIVAPIEAALRLCNVLTAIRSGNPLGFDVEDLSRTMFVDGANGTADQFFVVEAHSRFRRGSYDGDRVSISFYHGSVNRALRRYKNREGEEVVAEEEDMFLTYDTSWTTLRGDMIVDRADDLFAQDTKRIARAADILANSASLQTERPATWEPQVRDIEAYKKAFQERSFQTVYVGDEPLTDIVPEPRRKVDIWWLK